MLHQYLLQKKTWRNCINVIMCTYLITMYASPSHPFLTHHTSKSCSQYPQRNTVPIIHTPTNTLSLSLSLSRSLLHSDEPQKRKYNLRGHPFESKVKYRISKNKFKITSSIISWNNFAVVGGKKNHARHIMQIFCSHTLPQKTFIF